MLNLFRKRTPTDAAPVTVSEPAPEGETVAMTTAEIKKQLDELDRPPTLNQVIAEANRARTAAKDAYNTAASTLYTLEGQYTGAIARASHALTPREMAAFSSAGFDDLRRRMKQAEIVKRRAEVAWRRACQRCQALERERGRRRAVEAQAMIAKRNAALDARREDLGLPPHGDTVEHLAPVADLIAAYPQTQHGPTAPAAREETFLGMRVTRSA